MKFLARFFAEIFALIFVVIMATRVLSTDHPGVAGMILVSTFVVVLSLRATIQREMIKDDAALSGHSSRPPVRLAGRAWSK